MLQSDRPDGSGALMAGRNRLRRGHGWTLLEVAVALTLLVMLGSFGVVRYTKTLETASLDLAVGHLESVWTAQRFFWLENGEFAESVADLEDGGFLDASRPPAESRYQYKISSANANSFKAQAKRTGSRRWKGKVSIDETGELSGKIKSKSGVVIEPVGR